MTLFLLVFLAALAFEFINGFHDAANAIATVVATRVLTARQAILLAAVFNVLGSLMGTTVAVTIGKGLVDTEVITMTTVLAGLSGAIAWNLITWWYGIPSSSSHALIGGLCGAAVARAGADFGVLRWNEFNVAKQVYEGIWPKVVVPMFTSPLVGFIIALFLMLLLTALFFWITPTTGHKIFGRLQLVSASFMAFSHGHNDAQKTMGILALALFTGTRAELFDSLPGWLHFLRTPTFTVPLWVVILCALTMGLGTAQGGWRIIRTLGHKIARLQPVHGFAAETTAALVIHGASLVGMPISTTHVISCSIMGVGAAHNPRAVRWPLVTRIVLAWILTIPVTGLLGWSFLATFELLGLH